MKSAIVMLLFLLSLVKAEYYTVFIYRSSPVNGNDSIPEADSLVETDEWLRQSVCILDDDQLVRTKKVLKAIRKAHTKPKNEGVTDTSMILTSAEDEWFSNNVRAIGFTASTDNVYNWIYLFFDPNDSNICIYDVPDSLAQKVNNKLPYYLEVIALPDTSLSSVSVVGDAYNITTALLGLHEGGAPLAPPPVCRGCISVIPPFIRKWFNIR